ncbi:hypothetical protein LRAMOSA02230 [Lichtheimia ramosa]|uniref:N-lysine methyltransferase SETD6 n=1 Tax=Lichtheimia ramosa TaxID=688394 RepID=A0A077WND3_9FUNG|nr:hypothetical protein LRAMOSA02230 [Lichtheimia ramosa]
MTDFEAKGQAFWQWLETNGATLSNGIGFKDYRSEGAGRGVVATRDIKEDEELFSIPRPLLLSVETSKLRDALTGDDVLDKMTGWSPLILCLMYESQRDDSFWKPYFDVLPKEFSTPMFWSLDDIKELEGTDIVEKIGKKEADEIFSQEIEPVIKNHPDLFDPAVHNLDLFHRCGSLIMAYSFHDEKDAEEDADDDREEEDEDEEAPPKELLAMVPMADMLNHKTGYNNARLFHESDCLRMKAIKDIREGEQIYNTYGELCNADLLRKYGFADENNPFDLCELNGGQVIDMFAKQDKLRDKKIEFLMEEEALDDCFVVDTDHVLPDELVSTLHVLRASDEEFKQIERKQKLPKPRLTAPVIDMAIDLLQARLKRYPTSLDADMTELQQNCSTNKRHALLVRIGEKQIIHNMIDKLQQERVKRSNENDDEASRNKRQKTA